ncbi:MAG: PDZ domain-containing protein [Candidatus Caenarcaniphilales bacterium]|jgi:hypothetical protein|nr:PDZ domain-containing protein [Candidatus Caenarcaniphilales bacterium]
MKKTFSCLIIIFLLGGCSDYEKLKIVCDSYLGYKQSFLIQNFGQPKKIISNNSDKIFEYGFIEHNFNLSPSLGVGSGPIIRGTNRNNDTNINLNYNNVQGTYSTTECRLTFTIDRNDEVKSWHQSGNACTAYAVRNYVNQQYILDLPEIVDEVYGFNVDKNSSGLRVKDVHPESKAYESGLRKNDLISRINDKEIKKLPIEFALDILKKNTKVKLTLKRKSGEEEIWISQSKIPRLSLYSKSTRKFLGFDYGSNTQI